VKTRSIADEGRGFGLLTKGDEMIGKTVRDMQVGEKAEVSKTISESDVYLFAGITGDFNPAHVNEVYASSTFFKTRIAHGMLAAGFISSILGNHLPGPGTIYIRQEFSFLAPVRIGDTLTACAEVSEIDAERNRVKLKTTCLNQDGILVIEGEALVSPPKETRRDRTQVPGR
jgi:3-hydroxybutyryl-CoA dehydratase